MGKTRPIPRYLGINWWWLLMIGAAGSYLRQWLHIPVWIPDLDYLWLCVQAYWLLRAEPRSKALYFYLATGVIGGIFLLLPANAVTHHGWLSALVIMVALADVGLWLAGIFGFRSEMEAYFNENSVAGLSLSGVMTFFFSVLYFQYWFHQLYLEQQQQEEGLYLGSN
jgi:hypothetical protein